VTKFFGTELGAQTTYAADTERAVVNGAHTTQDLQTNMFKYVEKFVLCPHCRLPETSKSARKIEDIM
jgi:translation initiation factor 5